MANSTQTPLDIFVANIRTIQNGDILPKIRELHERLNSIDKRIKQHDSSIIKLEAVSGQSNIALRTAINGSYPAPAVEDAGIVTNTFPAVAGIPFVDVKKHVNQASRYRENSRNQELESERQKKVDLEELAKKEKNKMQGLVTYLAQLDLVVNSVKDGSEVERTKITVSENDKREIILPVDVNYPSYEVLAKTTVENLESNLKQGLQSSEGNKNYEHTGVYAAVLIVIEKFKKLLGLESSSTYKTDTEKLLTKSRSKLFAQAKAINSADKNETSMGNLANAIKSAGSTIAGFVADAFSEMSQYNISHYGVAVGYCAYTC